jgi:hypothetical protein
VVGFWQMIRMALGAFNDNSDNGANNNANKNE